MRGDTVHVSLLADAVFRQVEAVFGLDREELLWGRKLGARVARSAAAVRLRFLGYSSGEIARSLRRDHTTILSIQRQGKRYANDPAWRAAYVAATEAP